MGENDASPPQEFGFLPSEVARYLGEGPNMVYCSRETMKKIREKHPTVDEEALKQVRFFEKHRYFLDTRKRRLSVIGVVGVTKLYKIAIKRTKASELLITTVHETHGNQVRSFEKRFSEIKLAQ